MSLTFSSTIRFAANKAFSTARSFLCELNLLANGALDSPLFAQTLSCQ
jgi:hypothetical protein